jgi:hypothetical protein
MLVSLDRACIVAMRIATYSIERRNKFRTNLVVESGLPGHLSSKDNLQSEETNHGVRDNRAR